MIRILLLLSLLLATAVPLATPAQAAEYRFGVPAGYVTPTVDQLITFLRTSVLTQDETLTVVPVDLRDADTEPGRGRIRREIAAKCDLFFATGNYLTTVFALGVTSPVLFIGTRNPEHEIPAAMRNSATGFYWGPTATVFKRAAALLPAERRKRLGLIFYRGSGLEDMQAAYEETARKLGMKLVAKEYDDSAEIGRVMRQFKQEGTQALLLFPPAIRKGEMKDLVRWQNELGLPVIAQVRQHVEEGAMGGPVIDYKLLIPKLADYAAKILRGRSPDKLPVQFVSRRYLINLATVSRLGIAIPQEIIDQAEIVGLASEEKTPRRSAEVPLVAGDFRIGIPATIPVPILDRLTAALAARGYLVGKNLHLEPIEITGKEPLPQRRQIIARIEARCDLFLASGNVLPELFALDGLKKPVCFIATQESAAALTAGRDNFTGVVRGSVESTMRGAWQMTGAGKRIGLLARRESNLKQLLAIYRRAAAAIGIAIHFYEFSGPAEIEAVMRRIKSENDFILLFPPAVTAADLDTIVKWQNDLRLPVVAQRPDQVRSGLFGGLISDEKRIIPKVAEYIDKLLQGRKASTLPVFYYPERYAINLRTASVLQIKIPDEITAQAEIIY